MRPLLAADLAQGFVVSQRITDGRETPTCAECDDFSVASPRRLIVENRLKGVLPGELR